MGKKFYILSCGFALSTLIFAFSYPPYAIRYTSFCPLCSVFCPLFSTTVENPLQIHPFFCKTNPISKKSSVRNLFINNELLENGHLVKWEKRTQNEPKFKKVEMNVKSYITKGYENISNWAICENEPKTNPILRACYKQMTSQSLTKLFLDTPVDCNLIFKTQRIDGHVQIGKISGNVCYAHKGLCF